MKRENKQFVIIVGIISVTILLIPIIFLCDIKDSLTLGSSILSACCSAATLAIAYLLYDKFGVGKKVIDKQTDVVFQLLEEIRRLRIFINIKEESWGHFRKIIISKDMKNDLDPKFNNRYLVFEFSNYNDGFDKVLKLQTNIFLPIEISTEMNFLKLYSLETITNIDNYKNNSIEVEINKSIQKNVNTHFGRINENDIKYIDFINSWENLVNVIEQWLNSHSDNKISLNL